VNGAKGWHGVSDRSKLSVWWRVYGGSAADSTTPALFPNDPVCSSVESVNFLPSALSLTRKLSKGSRLLKSLGQIYSIEQR
jgi:hypothetical protein